MHCSDAVEEKITKVLVAVDNSKFSEVALEPAIVQFDSRATEVPVIHIVEPIAVSVPPPMAPGYASELRDQVKESQELVDHFAKTLSAAGFKVDTKVARGDVRETIIDSPAEWHANIIVIGSHGWNGIRRFLLGSVPEFVVRHATCSVEIVRIPAS